MKTSPQRIGLLSDIPIACRPYRLFHRKMKVMKKDIDKLLYTKVINPSRSPYAALCLLIYKKNRKPRLVTGFKNHNKIIKPVQYPLPHLETALQSFSGNKVFSTLDLLSGYHHLPLREENREKKAFTKDLDSINSTKFHSELSPLEHTCSCALKES